MGTYLVVAHQTASSPELVLGLSQFLKTQDPTAQFVLLVPATQVQHLPGAREGDNWQIAREVALDAKADLEAAGILVETVVGHPSPIKAIEEEFARGRRTYDGIIVSTLPAGISRWLRLDLPHRARKFGVPVSHIVAESAKRKELV